MSYAWISPGERERSLRRGVVDHHHTGCAGAHSRIPEWDLPLPGADSLRTLTTVNTLLLIIHIYQDWITKGLE